MADQVGSLNLDTNTTFNNYRLFRMVRTVAASGTTQSWSNEVGDREPWFALGDPIGSIRYCKRCWSVRTYHRNLSLYQLSQHLLRRWRRGLVGNELRRHLNVYWVDARADGAGPLSLPDRFETVILSRGNAAPEG